MEFLESQILKKNPDRYKGIVNSVSWILKEKFIYNYFSDNFKKDYKILDIGCGSGYFLQEIKKLGFDSLFGADIANYLKDRSITHQSLDINIEKLNFKDDQLDVVTAFQVLEHLENYFLIEQEVKRVLRSGGYFIFAIPNHLNIFYRIKFAITGNMTGFDLANNHLLFLTKDVFRKTFLKDFDLIDIYYNRGPVPLLGRFNVIPGVKFSARTRILPRHRLLADRMCYILRKK